MEPEIEESTGSVEIESSTDTVEQVAEALGGEVEESPAEKAAAKDSKKEPAATEEEAEVAEESDDEAEAEEEAAEAEEEAEEEKPEEKPAKKAPTVVSRKRLNEVIAQRNRERSLREAAERKLSERETAKPTKEEAADTPQNFSGKPEPRIEDFLDKADKYPDPYAAFTKAYGAWVREETLAKVEVDRAQEAAQAEERKLKETFNKNVKAALTRIPDYHEIVNSSDVQISALMERRVKKSAYAADLLVHFVQNPDDAADMMAMDQDDQVAAMIELEARIKAEIANADDEEKPAAKVKPKATIPPKKASSAPAPPARLKSTGPTPKTLDELAGPPDKTGIDIDFNPAYERAVKAQRRT